MTRSEKTDHSTQIQYGPKGLGTIEKENKQESSIVLSVSPLVSFLFLSFLIPCNFY